MLGGSCMCSMEIMVSFDVLDLLNIPWMMVVRPDLNDVIDSYDYRDHECCKQPSICNSG